ncbi:MAG TPA: substrate-binding domain-containing protein [Candidatus Limnocylindria bacterium]|nr:substrate-binding domain-containing protein [Candidatus Limnocylindria bacterium]
MAVANHVREARARRHLSQAQLADLAGTSRQTVIAVERGASVPSVDLALRLAQALERRVDDLFEIGAAERGRRPLVIAGSDDPGLAVLADRLRPELLLSLAALGSTAGLESLRAGEADLSGIHFEDNERRVLGLLPQAGLIHFARREQGVVLRVGRRLSRLEDLAALRLVLRRPGTGTRLLFDRAVPRKSVRRVVAEVQTHAEVAAAVLRGEADGGTATRAIAVRYGLGFFRIAWERFDLALTRELLDDTRIATLRAALADRSHRRAIESLGGYDLADAGKVTLP